MANLFSTLSLPLKLSLDSETIEAAWRQATLAEHPDLKGSADTTESSALIHEARQVLEDPAGRLDHWLSVHEVKLSRDTSITPELMDLFSSVHSSLEEADSLIKKIEAASSDLAKALFAKAAVSAQLQIQEQLKRITEQREQLIARFPAIEDASTRGDFSDAVATVGQLKFLNKWEQQCQTRLIALIAC